VWRVYYCSNTKDEDEINWSSHPMKKDIALVLLQIFTDALYIKKVSGWFGVGKIIYKTKILGKEKV